MRLLPILLLSVLGLAGLRAEEFRGFLLTKDNYHLTGYVNQINYVFTGLEIEFTNDFGDRYHISPRLVKGFGFTHDGETYRYVSRYSEGRWYFLRILRSDRKMLFFSTPDGREGYVDDSLLSVMAASYPQYWLEIPGQPLLGVPRMGFRRKMREYLTPTAPDLARLMGKKGYRYRNLTEIVDLYCSAKKRRSKRL